MSILWSLPGTCVMDGESILVLAEVAGAAEVAREVAEVAEIAGVAVGVVEDDVRGFIVVVVAHVVGLGGRADRGQPTGVCLQASTLQQPENDCSSKSQVHHSYPDWHDGILSSCIDEVVWAPSRADCWCEFELRSVREWISEGVKGAPGMIWDDNNSTPRGVKRVTLSVFSPG